AGRAGGRLRLHDAHSAQERGTGVVRAACRGAGARGRSAVGLARSAAAHRRAPAGTGPGSMSSADAHASHPPDAPGAGADEDRSQAAASAPPDFESLSGPTSTGVDARLAAVLGYAGWWITGLIFLFLERDNRAVRFHAAQSLVVFGGLSLLMGLVAALSATT